MKKTVFYFLFLTAVIAAGWHYMPNGWRGKIYAFAGAAFNRDGEEIKNLIRKEVLPPSEKENLVRELKKNMAEIKKAYVFPDSKRPSAQTGKTVSTKKTDSAGEIRKLIESSEEIIEKIAEIEEGGGAGLASGAAKKILEAVIFPEETEKNCVCR